MTLDQPIVSQQLAVLRNQGIVSAQKEGLSVRYTLRDPLVGELLDVARRIFNNHLASTRGLLRELRREGRGRRQRPIGRGLRRGISRVDRPSTAQRGHGECHGVTDPDGTWANDVRVEGEPIAESPDDIAQNAGIHFQGVRVHGCHRTASTQRVDLHDRVTDVQFGAGPVRVRQPFDAANENVGAQTTDVASKQRRPLRQSRPAAGGCQNDPAPTTPPSHASSPAALSRVPEPRGCSTHGR